MHRPSPSIRNLTSVFRRDSCDSGGFVLVAVLLLIALATVLIVTTSGISQIERKAVSNSAKEEIARQNALFALNVALAQLQASAGPDQRVTAMADILSPTNGSSVANPYWTGVWMTGTNGLDIVNSGTPQRQLSLGSTTPTTNQIAANAVAWLVSGATNYAVASPSATTVNPLTWMTNATNSVVLAQNYGTNATNVSVPLVKLTNSYTVGSVTHTNLGAYAYWVSDEGVKAKVSLLDPTYGSSVQSSNQIHYWVPQANAVFKGLLGSSNTIDLRSNSVSTNFLKITTLQSLQNLPGISSGSLAGTNASQFAADATTYSMGVLADVCHGGLKKDLTAAFENTNTFTTNLMTNYGEGYTMLYRASVDGIPTNLPYTPSYINPDGYLWYNLYVFYNLYKGTVTAPLALAGSPKSIPPNGVGNANNTLPYTFSTQYYAFKPSSTAPTTLNSGGIYPGMIAFRVNVALDSTNVGTVAAPQYALRIRYYPQLVLYNPYSVNLSLQNYQFQKSFNAWADPAHPSTITIKVGTNTAVTTQFNPSGRITLQTQAGDCDSLAPGETRVFGLDANVSCPDMSSATTFTNPNLRSDVNISFDNSYYTTNIPNVPLSTNGSDMVTVTIYNPGVAWNSGINSILPRTAVFPSAPSSGGGFTSYINAMNLGYGLTPATGTFNFQISALATPYTLTGFYWRAKGLTISDPHNLYYMANTPLPGNSINNVPVLHGNSSDITVFDDGWYWAEFAPITLGKVNSDLDPISLVQSADGIHMETSWGVHETGVDSSNTRIVLRDVPTQPMISLGQFMHLPSWTFQGSGGNANITFGTMFVGGSYASPIVPTTNSIITNNGLNMDDSFLANQALFDRFFFSTVPPSGSAPGGTTWPGAWTAFNTANSGTTLSDPSKPLLNARMKPYYTGGTNPPVMANLRDIDKAAANLMLDGAFNVNSTSVPAWTAFLGGLSGNALSIYSGINASTQNLSSMGTGGNQNPIPRFWSASATATPNGHLA